MVVWIDSSRVSGLLSSNRVLSIVLILIGLSFLGNLVINQTAAAPGLSSLDVSHAYDFAWVDQNMNSTSASTTSLLNSTSTSSEQSTNSSITATASSSPTMITSSTTATTTGSNQTTASSTSSFASSTTINSAGPGVTQNDNTTTVTITSTATSYEKHFTFTKTLGSSAGYSISFNPPFWLCTDVSVTFTGPLVESGFYGDTLQFQYFQYNPSYPSILNPIFMDPSLTVTSDSVSYWIHYPEYAPVSFAYMPDVAVKVIDVTPKSNGYAPGLIFMQLTNITPESYQSCQIGSTTSTPEFQAQWVMVMVSLAMGSVFLQVHLARKRHNHGRDGNGLIRAQSRRHSKKDDGNIFRDLLLS